jgi:hypothetical protein
MPRDDDSAKPRYWIVSGLNRNELNDFARLLVK